MVREVVYGQGSRSVDVCFVSFCRGVVCRLTGEMFPESRQEVWNRCNVIESGSYGGEWDGSKKGE